MKRCPPSLHCIVIEAAALVAVHFALLQILARVNLLEHLLAPGTDSRFALIATTVFLLLRVCLFVFAPGWLLARLWLWATRQSSGKSKVGR